MVDEREPGVRSVIFEANIIYTLLDWSSDD